MKTNRFWSLDGRWFSRAVNLLIVLALVLALVPQNTAQAAACKFKHKVKGGETLTSIAALYNYDWKEIAEANELKEPYVLTVGQVLCIPGGTKPTGTTTTTTTTGETKKAKPTVTIVSSLRHVFVQVTNFPKYITYYVKVYTKNDPYNPERIGRLRTNKSGAYEGWFPLPVTLDQTKIMTLCLKNVWTDDTACVDYNATFYDYEFPEVGVVPIHVIGEIEKLGR
ncbi:MAG: LysM peptidoglycan-binding domain-containing protein [Chloroflexota bacterium]